MATNLTSRGKFMVRKWRSAFAGVVALGLGIFSAGEVSAQATLKGAGSTFAYPVYSKWFSAFQKKDGTVNFEYGYVGSSEGIRQVLAKEVEFGATDAPLSDAQLSNEGKNILHIPTFAGGVVLAYNLPGQLKLKLDGETISDLFLGKITKWNDERLAKLNPEVALPDLAVTIVHRSEGSGTTSIFTEYLGKVSAEWKEKVGVGKAVKWPVGKGAKGNKGVVQAIKSTAGALGYAEHAVVVEFGLPDAAIKNRSGKYVHADVESVHAALATATIPDDLRFSLTDAPGDAAYPISGATWLLVPTKGEDLAKSRKLVQFLKWALSEGDEMVRQKGCAPLPEELQQMVLARLKRIKTP